MHDVWKHPQLQARQHWQQIDSPVGALPALLPPASSNAFTPRMDPVPAVSGNTDAVLAFLGYGAQQIAQWRAQEIL